MFTFTDQNSIIYRTGGASEPGDFNSEQELLKLADARGVSREGLQTVYDGLVGDGLAEPTKRLRNRPYAVSAIWKAVQRLNPEYQPEKVQPEQMFNGRPPKSAGPVAIPVEPKPGKRQAKGAAKEIPPAAKPVLPKRKTKAPGNDRAKAKQHRNGRVAKKEGGELFRAGSKAAQALSMMRRDRGASGGELQEKLEWQAHSVRGFVSTLQSKHKIKVSAEKDEKRGMVYTIG